MKKLNLNSKITKRVLSITLDDLLTSKTFKELPTIYWKDQVVANDARHVTKKDLQPHTGIMNLYDFEDPDGLNELSKQCLLLGLQLGSEIYAGDYRSKFLGRDHGLHFCLNRKTYHATGVAITHEDKAAYHKAVQKLTGTNPSPPDWIRFKLFGANLADCLFRQPNVSRFSIKFFDNYIKESLTQDNLINNLLLTTAHENPEIRIEIIRILRNINNFDSFLNDEMNRLKDDFKGFKPINNTYDCANLLFIYNPLFKEVMDHAFEQYYLPTRATTEQDIFDYEEFMAKLNKPAKQKKDQKKDDSGHQTSFDFKD